MSEIIFNETVAPSTPAAGKGTVYLDGADKVLKLKDSTGAITLLEQDAISPLLYADPTITSSYTNTYDSGLISQEIWRRPDTTKIKKIDYTYTSGLVSQEIRRVYADDGATVIGRVTFDYTYSSGILTAVAETRDV